MDCRYCEVQVEITKRAYAARCPDPVAVLDYIRERLKSSTRPRVDLADMKRVRLPPAPPTPKEEEEEMTKADSDALTTAAKAIGTTLGKLAVKTGMAKPPASPTIARKKVAAKKKAPAAKAAAGAKGKTAPKKSPKKPISQRKPGK